MPVTHSRPRRVIVYGQTAIRIFNESDVIGLAQQIAYNVLFAIAPLMIFLTAFCSLVIQRVNADIDNPVEPILEWLDENLPADAAEFLKGPVESALSTSPEYLLSIGGILTLWAAKNAIGAVMKGLNATYGLKDTRSYLKKNLIALLLTIGLAVSALVSGILQLLGTGVGQDIAVALGFGTEWDTAVRLLQLPITGLMITLIFVVIHRFAPMFQGPFRWYLPGALFTTIGLAVATYGLQLYFKTFGGYSAAYGVFGAALAFIFWLFVIGIVILAGGVVNATLFEVFPPAKTALVNYREENHLRMRPGNADSDHEDPPHIARA